MNPIRTRRAWCAALGGAAVISIRFISASTSGSRSTLPTTWFSCRIRAAGVDAGAHIDWCASRYASYRLWDNTDQPYHGPRRQCRSPYR